MSSKAFVQTDSAIVIQLALSCKKQKCVDAQFYEKMPRKPLFSFKIDIIGASISAKISPITQMKLLCVIGAFHQSL